MFWGYPSRGACAAFSYPMRHTAVGYDHICIEIEKAPRCLFLTLCYVLLSERAFPSGHVCLFLLMMQRTSVGKSLPLGGTCAYFFWWCNVLLSERAFPSEARVPISFDDATYFCRKKAFPSGGSNWRLKIENWKMKNKCFSLRSNKIMSTLSHFVTAPLGKGAYRRDTRTRNDNWSSKARYHYYSFFNLKFSAFSHAHPPRGRLFNFYSTLQWHR